LPHLGMISGRSWDDFRQTCANEKKTRGLDSKPKSASSWLGVGAGRPQVGPSWITRIITTTTMTIMMERGQEFLVDTRSLRSRVPSNNNGNIGVTYGVTY